MSHSKERHEKICLNCSSELHGRYCHQCGQENIEPKESVWGLISHFFYDITHFDGKFFSTTRTLIAKPGFLPREYITGRRARYLHPIRMYVFSSALFFLVFFSLFHVQDIPDFMNGNNDEDTEETASGTDTVALPPKGTYRYRDDNTRVAAITIDSAVVKADSTDQPAKQKKKRLNMEILGKKIETVAQYDSAQAALPAKDRDGWFSRRLNTRNLELKEKYGDHEDLLLKDLLNKFFHTFPYLLFLSLPLYALFLKLLYIRRKQFYYTDHGIFLIYLYIFTFVVLLVFFSIDKLEKASNWSWLWTLELLLFGYGTWYAFRAMRKFYGQSRLKTAFKFVVLNILAVISLIFLFILFFAISVFQL